jgi:hypothetical protein
MDGHDGTAQSQQILMAVVMVISFSIFPTNLANFQHPKSRACLFIFHIPFVTAARIYFSRAQLRHERAGRLEQSVWPGS